METLFILYVIISAAAIACLFARVARLIKSVDRMSVNMLEATKAIKNNFVLISHLEESQNKL